MSLKDSLKALRGKKKSSYNYLVKLETSGIGKKEELFEWLVQQEGYENVAAYGSTGISFYSEVSKEVIKQDLLELSMMKTDEFSLIKTAD